MTNQATFDFIRAHAEDDVRRLALQGNRPPEVDLTYALEQIAGRQKARTKLPGWAALDAIVYPPHLSMEQCSSELTARYKAGLAGRGRLMVDLTGGFGVDFAFMAPGFERAVYVEQNEQLCAISAANFRTLGLTNAAVSCADGIGFLHSIGHADLIFLDPARRDSHGARTYSIADCTPNVLEVIDELTAKAGRILLKLSPMLDWRKALADIGRAAEVHIVSVDYECKELLLVLKEGVGVGHVVCVNLLSDGGIQRFEFDASELAAAAAEPASPVAPRYLFEPNASLMKAGCFALLAGRFGSTQPDANSHLFVSDHDAPDFPGRRFAIDRVTSLNRRELKTALAGISRANISVRNFPMTVDELRRRLRLKDGGDTFIFATTAAGEGHRLFICRKIG